MYEPLLQVTLPDHLVTQFKFYPHRVAENRYRVIIVGEVWDQGVAHRNTAELVQRLLQTGKVHLVATGDCAEGYRPTSVHVPLTISVEERDKLIREAKEDLEAGRITSVYDYLARVTHGVTFVGINKSKLLEEALLGRERRKRALLSLYTPPDTGAEVLNPDESLIIDVALDGLEWEESVKQFLDQVSDEQHLEQIWQEIPDALRVLINEAFASFFQSAGRGLTDLFQIPGAEGDAPTPSIPLLDTLKSHLTTLKEKWWVDTSGNRKAIWEAENLIDKTRNDLGYLPELLRFATEQGLSLSGYPTLKKVCDIAVTERLNPARLQQEQQWLRDQVHLRLMGGKVDSSGGVRTLFNKELRQIVHTGKDPLHLLESPGPLRRCANHALRSLMGTAADAIERNDSASLQVASDMLDIASLFLLNDDHYSLYRAMVGAQLRGFTARACLADVEKISHSLMKRFTERGEQKEIDRQLWNLVQQLDTLEKLAKEELSADDAERTRNHPVSVREVMAAMEALEISFTAREKEQARMLDEEVLAGARNFYDSCQEQARVMVEGLESCMIQSHSDMAILLCGAYHLGGIAEELDKRGKEFAYSILVPQVFEMDSSERTLVLEEVRKAAEPSLEDNIQIVHLKDGMTIDQDREPDIRHWIARRYSRVVLEEAFAECPEIEDLLTEDPEEIRWQTTFACRVCQRRLPILWDWYPVSCVRDAPPLGVLICRRCADASTTGWGKGAYLCNQCAGRASAAFLPGHGGGRCGARAEFGGSPGM